jgi:hypothetical protein
VAQASKTLITDQAWAKICAAAEQHKPSLTPDAGTRERLSVVLFEQYPVFHYDREQVAAVLHHSERMLSSLDKFAGLYRQAFWPKLSADQFEIVLAGLAGAVAAGKPDVQFGFWCITRLRRQVLRELLGARAIRRANRGQGDPQFEWLCNQLCTAWLWDFHAPDLKYSVPSGGGAPYGPLIAFMLAAIDEVVVKEEELPSVYALRDAIVRERVERENSRQFGLFMKHRMPLKSDMPS